MLADPGLSLFFIGIPEGELLMEKTLLDLEKIGREKIVNNKILPLCLDSLYSLAFLFFPFFYKKGRGFLLSHGLAMNQSRLLNHEQTMIKS